MAEEGIDKVKAADAAVDESPAPAPVTPTEPATPPVAQGPAVLDTLQLQAILSHPQIQEHIAASQKPIQSARDKERQRANAAEQAANLSDEDRTTLLDRQSVLNDAITFYSEVKGTPKEDLEDVRDLKELMGRVRLIKASATMVDPSKVDPALQTAALKAAASGTTTRSSRLSAMAAARLKTSNGPKSLFREWAFGSTNQKKRKANTCQEQPRPLLWLTPFRRCGWAHGWCRNRRVVLGIP